jgi:hypothetical protein
MGSLSSRLDIAVAVMTLSGFRSNPRQGHLQRAKRVVVTFKFCHASIRYRVGLLDKVRTEVQWDTSVHGKVEELLPQVPLALGKTVDTTTHVDANLYHRSPLSLVLFIT